MTYWPWWLGALAFGVITAGYAAWTGRTLGVSGAWHRVLTWREARAVERLDAEWNDNVDLRAALAAATHDQFGSADRAAAGASPAGVYPLATLVGQARTGPPAQLDHPLPRRRAVRRTTARRPLSPVFGATLLVSVFVGGLLAASTSGRFELRTDMGEGYSRIVTDSPALMVALLFLGGVLVGFGTRMAGGCTSGHGLTGCSRLHPVSLVATAVFFGTAVATSFLLWKVI